MINQENFKIFFDKYKSTSSKYNLDILYNSLTRLSDIDKEILNDLINLDINPNLKIRIILNYKIIKWISIYCSQYLNTLSYQSFEKNINIDEALKLKSKFGISFLKYLKGISESLQIELVKESLPNVGHMSFYLTDNAKKEAVLNNPSAIYWIEHIPKDVFTAFLNKYGKIQPIYSGLLEECSYILEYIDNPNDEEILSATIWNPIRESYKNFKYVKNIPDYIQDMALRKNIKSIIYFNNPSYKSITKAYKRDLELLYDIKWSNVPIDIINRLIIEYEDIIEYIPSLNLDLAEKKIIYENLKKV